MSDAVEQLLRTFAELVFCKQPTYSTKDIFNHIDKKKFENNIRKITQFVLKEMFCENTGTHFLDSGGAYGRGWQRAQAVKDRDWMESESTRVNVEYYNNHYDFYVLKNTYLFLCEQLEYDLEMDQSFHKWSNSNKDFKFYKRKANKVPLIGTKKEEIRNEETYMVYSTEEETFNPKEKSYYSCMIKWIEWLKQAPYKEIEDFEDIGGYNTYNGDSCLDKILQWEMFEIANGMYQGHYIILQIHNGCDVRGGYSTPHIFQFEYDHFYSMINGLGCRCPNFKWGEERVQGVQKNLDGKNTKDPVIDLDHVDCYSDDDGYHWYENSGENIEKGAKFITDEEGKHHIVCKKCGTELEFW